jgi:hypothetical protein
MGLITRHAHRVSIALAKEARGPLVWGRLDFCSRAELWQEQGL